MQLCNFLNQSEWPSVRLALLTIIPGLQAEDEHAIQWEMAQKANRIIILFLVFSESQSSSFARTSDAAKKAPCAPASRGMESVLLVLLLISHGGSRTSKGGGNNMESLRMRGFLSQNPCQDMSAM